MSSRLTSPRPDEVAVVNERLSRVLWDWVSRVTTILGGRQPLQLSEHTVAGLPDATKWQGCIIAVTDESGGYVSALSDGTNWRRSTDRAIVS